MAHLFEPGTRHSLRQTKPWLQRDCENERCTDPSPEFVETDEALVCTSCGTCVRGYQVLCIGHSDLERVDLCASRNTERRIFHLNERLAQFQGMEPSIHPIDLGKILLMSRMPQFRHRQISSKADVQQILRALRDEEPQHVTEKTRWAYFDKPFKKRSFTIYLERHLSIKYFINKNRGLDDMAHLPKPHGSLIRYMRKVFLEMQRPFSIFKHVEGCPGGGKRCCLKEPGRRCRVNFLSYDGVLKCILVMASKTPLRKHDPLQYLDCFPGLKSPEKVRKFLDTFLQIKHYLGWDFVEDSDFDVIVPKP